jgi:hypothetical protein
VNLNLVTKAAGSICIELVVGGGEEKVIDGGIVSKRVSWLFYRLVDVFPGFWRFEAKDLAISRLEFFPWNFQNLPKNPLTYSNPTHRRCALNNITAVIAIPSDQSEPLASIFVLAQLLLERLLCLFRFICGLTFEPLHVGAGCNWKSLMLN